MRSLFLIAAVAFGLAAAPCAVAQQGNYEPFVQPSGAQVPAFVMMCATGTGRQALPCGPASPLSVLTMPFQRTGDPILLPASPTPQQFQVAQPVGTRSYRGVNPCSVDIRIKTVASMSESVTASTGTRFLARTSETLASSPSLTGQTRIVSIMTVGDPGAGGCVFELGYGNGG